MISRKPSSLIRNISLLLASAAVFALAPRASAQLVADDNAANYIVSANWTNGANAGFGFGPWAIVTNGSDFHGTYIVGDPAFVIATVTNYIGTNYSDVWGVFANGPTDVNQTTVYR